MHKAQCRVAAIAICCNHSQGANVKHLIKAQRLAAHFFNNAVDVLGSALHQRCHAAFVQFAFKFQTQAFHKQLTLYALFVQQLGGFFIRFRLQKAKRQVFHLPLDLPNAQAVSQRREHMQ